MIIAKKFVQIELKPKKINNEIFAYTNNNLFKQLGLKYEEVEVYIKTIKRTKFNSKKLGFDFLLMGTEKIKEVNDSFSPYFQTHEVYIPKPYFEKFDLKGCFAYMFVLN